MLNGRCGKGFDVCWCEDMSSETDQLEKNPFNICIWKAKEECGDCSLHNEIHCEMHRSDTLMFGGSAMLFFIPSIGGMLLGGMWPWVIGYFIYWLIFFELWENRVLCSHCPFYAEDGGQGHTLHCYANYGLYKTWPYNPSPMSRSHQIQFLVALTIFGGYPIPFLILSNQLLFLGLTIAGIGIWLSVLKFNICPRCVNFSCPLNSVPKKTMDAFLKRNPVMMKAWIDSGYELSA